MYKDKIYEQLQDNYIRDKILNRELERQDYDNEAVYHFLKLLKQLEHLKNKTQQFNLISEDE